MVYILTYFQCCWKGFFWGLDQQKLTSSLKQLCRNFLHRSYWSYQARQMESGKRLIFSAELRKESRNPLDLATAWSRPCFKEPKKYSVSVSQVMELLVHVNKRLKSRPKIQLPVPDLIAQYQDPQVSQFVTVSNCRLWCLFVWRRVHRRLQTLKIFFPSVKEPDVF